MKDVFRQQQTKVPAAAASVGVACSANLLGRGFASGQTAQATQATPTQSAAVARIYIDSRRTIGALDRNLFGSFLEHLGRAIYEGIYDPGSQLSDGNGFRKDVMEEVRGLGVPIIWYPGGNFVSGYNWLDGVGPKKDRPRVLDKAWNTIDTNQFGTNEFMEWSKMVGARPLMGLNLGTGTPEREAALVEYCNLEKGTKWSDLRRSHGVEQPYKVEHWCLGNEMGGPWQIGHMTAPEYGLLESPTYEISELGQVPYLDVAGTLRPEDGRISLFILNRDLAKSHTVEIHWQDLAPGKLLNSTFLTGNDLKASNSFESPQRVVPRAFDKPGTAGGRTTFEVPARSYTVLQW